MKKIRIALVMTLILTLVIPLFTTHAQAENEQPTLEELVALAKEAEDFVEIVTGVYPYLASHSDEDLREWDIKLKNLAVEWGYIKPGFDIGKAVYPFDAIYVKTGEVIENIDLGCIFKYPDTVTYAKVKTDIEKYYASDFLGILDDKYSMYAVVGTDGKMYFHQYGMGGALDHTVGGDRPQWESARITSRNDNKITLTVDSYASSDITINYRITERGWRISGVFGGNYYSPFHTNHEVTAPETSDGTAVYIAIAALSTVCLAAITIDICKNKKPYTV